MAMLNFESYLIVIILTLATVTKCFGESPDNLEISKPEDVIWFIRKFPCPNSNCGNDFDNWKKENFELIDQEWESKKNLIGEISNKRLWIPLNGNDSLKLENIWRERKDKSCIENCALSGTHQLLDRLHMAKLYGSYGYLKPIYWQNEKATWLVLRSQRVYEVPHPLPVLYFMNIEANASMDTYWQPVPFWLQSKALDYNLNIQTGNPLNFTSTIEQTFGDHLIFVIHGIGHQQGEEGIVKNSYTIRKGFIKYLKKFHPNFKVPIIIPIPWRFEHPLYDETIKVTPMTKFDFIKSVGFMLNDVLYYLSSTRATLIEQLVNKLNNQSTLFKSHNPNFSGNISILAHSLGSALTFDLTNSSIYQKLDFKIDNIFLIGSPLGRFLASENIGDKLNLNPWITNGKLFNILHSNDPIAHRIEVLFNTNYSYSAPSNLFFDKDFRVTYEKSIILLKKEEREVKTFHQHVINDREMAASHDSFLAVDYLAYGHEFEFQNYSISDVYEIFKGNLAFLRSRFSGKKIRNDSQIIHAIPFEKRIHHRYDFDLYKSEYRSEEDDDDSYKLETQIIQWMGEFGYAHLCYWKRPEVIALMTNVIFNYSPTMRYTYHFSSDPENNLTRTHDIAWRIWKAAQHICCWISVIFLIYYLNPESLKTFYKKLKLSDFCKLVSECFTITSTLSFLIRVLHMCIFLNILSILMDAKPNMTTHITSLIAVLVFSYWLMIPKTLSSQNRTYETTQEVQLVEAINEQSSEQLNEQVSETVELEPMIEMVPETSQSEPSKLWNIFKVIIIWISIAPYLFLNPAENAVDALIHSIALCFILTSYTQINWFKFLLIPENNNNLHYQVLSLKTLPCVPICLIKYVWKILAVGSIFFIFLCPQDIITDLGLRSIALVFLTFHMLPEITKKLFNLNCENVDFRGSRNIPETIKYVCKQLCSCLDWQKIKSFISSHLVKLKNCVCICFIYLQICVCAGFVYLTACIYDCFSCRNIQNCLYFCFNWENIKKCANAFVKIAEKCICFIFNLIKILGLFIRRITQLLFCLLIIFLLFYLPSPDIFAEVGWNLRHLLNKVVPISPWWIRGIYIAIFLPSFLNFIMTERRYNLNTVYRLIYNYVLVLFVLFLVNLVIRHISSAVRNQELGCVHSDIEGYCREYIMYNNKTNTHVDPRIYEYPPYSED